MSTVKFVRLIYISKCKSILGTKIQIIIFVVIVTLGKIMSNVGDK